MFSGVSELCAAFQLLVTILAVVIVLYVIKYYNDRKRIFLLGSKLPGPKPWPIIGNALDFLDTDLDLLAKVNDYNKIYKGLVAVWLGPQLNVFINTAEDAEICFLSPNVLDRGEKSKFLSPILGKGILVSNGLEWKKGRKLMEQAFHHSLLKDFVSVYKTQSDILVQRLAKEVGKTAFPAIRYIEDCTFDITCDITFELNIKAQKQEVHVLDSVDRILTLVCRRLHRPWQYNDFVYRLFPEGREFDKKIGDVVDLIKQQFVIKTKQLEDEKKIGIVNKDSEDENDSKRKLYWRRLFKHAEEWGAEAIMHNALTMIVTGYDTTAKAICFVLIMLGMHQDVQEKAYQEALLTKDEEFDEALVHKLEYIDRVVKETLRLFPIIPITFRKANGDIQIGKHLVPKGAEVSINIFAIHRDPRHYENPNEFNPDNFLPEVVAKRPRHAYVPFTFGARKCIGSKFAMMSLKTVLTSILLNYKIECDYKMEDLDVKDDIALRMRDGYYIRILKREELS